MISKIINAAAAHTELLNYRWIPNRGKAPPGYVKGMALAYARLYGRLTAGDAAGTAPVLLAAVREMAKADAGDERHDALALYREDFAKAGLGAVPAGPDTLRHLFVLLIGLGMRESSGKHCEGRDLSADNVEADDAEAGLFQGSWNLHSAHPTMTGLFEQYRGKTDFLDVFRECPPCKPADAVNHGSGTGQEYQKLAKLCPAFAVEFTAVGLRNRQRHWGPVREKEVTIHPGCDAMLRDIQAVVDSFGSPAIIV